MRQLIAYRITDQAIFRRIARQRRLWAFLDRFVFRVVPAILLVIIFLLHYPPTATPIRRQIAEWYYRRLQPSPVHTTQAQPSLTRSTF
ncbi:MAG: hypothetical protein JNG90_15485 [Planctomycetaceae bacterium]|nr:hypothetical protein [Planctomycetaceae bacterium]